ncbi:MAG: hypothetical protein K2G04_03895, partial [Oscillospiraceae bacterium]|nr:hypothetical protein [Oscillospiraceae bacterium]
RIYVICKEDQNIEEGIIYEMEYNLLNFQPVLLGGQLDIHSDMEKAKAFLGEGNKFYDTSEYSETDYCTLFYTDGNRIIELSYGGQKDDMNFFTGYIRTYNNYEVGG